MGCDCLTGMGFSIGVLDCFGGRWRSSLYNILNVPSATNLYILEWLILCDVSFITVFKNYSNETARQTHSISCSLFGLGLTALVILQMTDVLFCLLSAMHPFCVYQGHRCKGFKTFKAWWYKLMYLLTRHQLFYSSSVGEGIRRVRVGFSRRPGEHPLNAEAPRMWQILSLSMFI